MAARSKKAMAAFPERARRSFPIAPTGATPALRADLFIAAGGNLSFAWNFGDGATSSAANPTHVYQTAGPYVVKLIVSDGVNSTPAADLHITVGTPPVPTITSPSNGSLFRAGDVIQFSGT